MMMMSMIDSGGNMCVDKTQRNNDDNDNKELDFNNRKKTRNKKKFKIRMFKQRTQNVRISEGHV